MAVVHLAQRCWWTFDAREGDSIVWGDMAQVGRPEDCSDVFFPSKDSREEAVLGSIPLPSYVISPVAPEDRISRKYSFKAVHTGMRALIYSTTTVGSQAEYSGMRTYYFSADTLEDMNAWVRAMNQAAQVLSRSSLKRSVLMEDGAGAPLGL